MLDGGGFIDLCCCLCQAYANVLKANMDGLKKKEKTKGKSKTKTNKAV